MNDNKQTVLTDEERADIHAGMQSYAACNINVFDFVAKAIESAVLSKLRAAGEPVGFVDPVYVAGRQRGMKWNAKIYDAPTQEATAPLYAAPQASADVRNAALEEAAKLCDERLISGKIAQNIRALKSAPAAPTDQQCKEAAAIASSFGAPDMAAALSSARGAWDAVLPLTIVTGKVDDDGGGGFMLLRFDERNECWSSRIVQPANSAINVYRQQRPALAAHKPDGGDAKDAERYRWLRDAHPTDREGLWVARGLPMSGLSCWKNEELDAAIDAAIAQQRPTGSDK